MNSFSLRIMLLLPWVFIFYVAANIISGDIGWLLGIVLLLILMPLAIVVNLITAFLVRGRQFVGQFRTAREQAQTRQTGSRAKSSAKTADSNARVKVKNYAEDKPASKRSHK